jgi:hypothetical protein
MYVQMNMRKPIVYLGYEISEGDYKPAGTGFFVSRPFHDVVNPFEYHTALGQCFLITAKHVVDGIRRKGSSVFMRANFHDGSSHWLLCEDSNWYFHPTQSDMIDVAAMRCTIPPTLDHVPLSTRAFATADNLRILDVSVGDEVFMSGLFSQHFGRERNIPIVRVGNIAAMMEEPVATQLGPIDAFLIEARSIGGLSGSPVFLNLPAARAVSLMGSRATQNSLTQFYALLGLVHGHWDARLEEDNTDDEVTPDDLRLRNVNMGIAIVIPCSKILEVLTACPT